MVSATTVSDSVTVYVTGNCTNGAINLDCTQCLDGSTTTPEIACPDIIPIGVLKGIDCEIKQGESFCGAELSWNINPTIIGAVTKVTKSSFITVSQVGAKSTDSTTDAISFGGTRYFLYHGGIELKNILINATCKATDFWDGKICANNNLDRDRWEDGWNDPCSLECGQAATSDIYKCIAKDGCSPDVKIRNCPATNSCVAPTVSIDVSPNSIRIGQSVKIKWNSVGMESCKSENLNFTTDGKTSGEITKTGLQKTTTFSVICLDSKGKTYPIDSNGKINPAKDTVLVDTSTIIEI